VAYFLLGLFFIKMKIMKNLTIIIMLLLNSGFLFSQVAINSDGSAPDLSAGLDIAYTNKGFLPPRLTFEQRRNINNPVEGLIVFCTNCNADGTGVLSWFQGGKWQNVLWNCPLPVTPLTGTHIPDVKQITWNWNLVPIAVGYRWNTVDDFSGAIYDLTGATTLTETDLTCNTIYTRFVWAYNDCGHSDALVLSQATSQVTFEPAPTPGEHNASMTQIIWSWHSIPTATGYKWNTINNYNNAIDMGNATTKTETSLLCGTEYTRYIWAYNACGASIATPITKKTSNCPPCPDPITDVRDGQVYNTVLINAQCWLTKNMNIGTMISSTTPQGNPNTIEKYCYNDFESNCTVYGGLYQWNNMMQWSTTPGIQGICPAGWHIPTDEEWTVLTDFLGANAGGKMKETGFTHWQPPNGGATNESGLTVLAGGYFDNYYGFSNDWTWAYFWSSTQADWEQSWFRALNYVNGNIHSDYNTIDYGFSVRCIKDL
jgi:uncharacterized protein (TIGR02145 family)